MPRTDLATPDDGPGRFLALTHDVDTVRQSIEDNLLGQDVNEFDLKRITVPSGKATKYRWEIPTLGDDSEVADEITGIIVMQKHTRAWWPGKPEQTGGSTPPSCSSPDGRTGYGKQWATIADPDPAGEPRQVPCKVCPHAQFGSGQDGRGQACKQSAQLFLLRETGFLPAVVSIPPTSLRAFKKYMFGLADLGISFDQVVTILGLEKATSGGNDHAVVTARLSGHLDPDTAEKARAYGAALSDTFNQVETAAAIDYTVTQAPVVENGANGDTPEPVDPDLPWDESTAGQAELGAED